MVDLLEKGTRVWFPDEHEGWISAELIKKDISGDAVKLAFVKADGGVSL